MTRKRIHEIIFEADTREGKIFDVILLTSILLSVIVVTLDSVDSLKQQYHREFIIVEYFFTFLFSIEYALRIYSTRKPIRYIFSFYGIIDFLAILPTYLGFVFVGSHQLVVIRILRLLRIFRVLKLARYVSASQNLWQSLQASRHKIFVFLWTVLTLVVIMGASMYMIEGSDSGFVSIPKGIYWAIVTLTTVGYGDIAPITPLGQILASAIMIMGYAIIAVPTGIITVEMALQHRKIKMNTQCCIKCHNQDHDDDAEYCKKCGSPLH